MGIDDPLLPAAVHLTGPHADDVLRPAIEHAGGLLRKHRCSQVHYRPGHDLIAQFRVRVDWGDGTDRRETVLAATTRSGPPAGTVAVNAETPDDQLTIGVWRWPFDPALPALERIVDSTVEHLAGVGVIRPGDDAEVEVVTYRPMERAVLRVRTPEANWYLKVVRPSAAPAMVARHRLLRASGLPVPEVVAADAEAGWMLISEIVGPTLRDLIKADADRWMSSGSFKGLLRRLASVDDATPAFRSRLADGPHHAALLATVLPEARDRLERLGEVLSGEAERGASRPRGFVHGDLHENQLIVADEQIVGLLDIDEAGMGDPIDDIAVPAAHLRHRALFAPNGARIDGLVDDLVSVAAADHDRRDIAAGTAAVVTGLATAPFRRQSEGWRERVRSIIDLAERQLEGR
jgi:aminoglycoside phosphotransferase (APT) family kinase protein